MYIYLWYAAVNSYLFSLNGKLTPNVGVLLRCTRILYSCRVYTMYTDTPYTLQIDI